MINQLLSGSCRAAWMHMRIFTPQSRFLLLLIRFRLIPPPELRFCDEP
jgi:hypothetical protein